MKGSLEWGFGKDRSIWKYVSALYSQALQIVCSLIPSQSSNSNFLNSLEVQGSLRGEGKGAAIVWGAGTRGWECVIVDMHSVWLNLNKHTAVSVGDETVWPALSLYPWKAWRYQEGILSRGLESRRWYDVAIQNIHKIGSRDTWSWLNSLFPSFPLSSFVKAGKYLYADSGESKTHYTSKIKGQLAPVRVKRPFSFFPLAWGRRLSEALESLVQA